MQISGKDRLIYGRAVEAVKDYGVPLDAVALEYSDARKLLDGGFSRRCRSVLRTTSWQGNKA